MTFHYPVDYHIHSQFTLDCDLPLEAVYQRAYHLGLKEIGLADFFSLHLDDPNFGYLDLDNYLERLESFSQTLASVTLRKGVEVDFQPRYQKRIAKALEDRPFDFVVGAVHYVDSLRCNTQEFYRGRNWSEVYRDYFANVKAAIESDLFDVIGHIDYPKWYGVTVHGPFQMDYYLEELESIFTAMAERNMVLEINTSGYNVAPREPFPDFSMVKKFIDCGGKHVTLGSDAKTYLDVGYGWQQALEGLSRIGITEIATIENRTVIPRSFKGD